jgi:diguanylate cyclase (GGDEF)-like protein
MWLAAQSHKAGKHPPSAAEELELRHGERVYYFSAAIHPLYWRGHNATAFVLTDVSNAKEKMRELENVAYFDTVTRVYNRHYGMKTLNEWLAEKKSFMICFVDMDNLKYVNDTFGHAEGDAYIMCVVALLRDFAPDALVCRLGGDEFMLLAQGWSMSDAEARMEELRNSLIQHNDAPGAFYNHSLSYGVIDAKEGGAHEASDLLSIADEKMYVYKRAHKSQRKT